MNKSNQSKRGNSAIRALLINLGLVAAILLLWWLPLRAPQASPFEPPQMATAHFSTRDVMGNLGGAPVTIPSHFANFVEYEGDPGWGEKRQGPRPERTHQSKLISFGYYTRLPDMAGESSKELIKDRRSYSIYQTPWISVGITTGRNYPGDGFLDRRAAYISKSGEILKYEQYEKLYEPQHGLTVYAAAGIDPKTNKRYREHPNAKDVFVHRDKKNWVDTYVDCSNRPGGSQPCTHNFSLEPHMHAKVYVSYRRSLLPQWQEIQQAVTQQILNFKSPRGNDAVKQR